MNKDKTKRILGLTLARGGSKSVPRKNIRPIAGIPHIGGMCREAQEIAYGHAAQRLTKFFDQAV